MRRVGRQHAPLARLLRSALRRRLLRDGFFAGAVLAPAPISRRASSTAGFAGDLRTGFLASSIAAASSAYASSISRIEWLPS
jgi:hypothetical protein